MPCGRRDGAALVIVLGFVVMLLMLLMAFFSQTTLERQLASASSGTSLDEIFASGVVETIVSDLRQEIAAGSSNSVTVTGSQTNTLYFPVTNTAMIPSVSGFITNNGLENVVKVSRADTPPFPKEAPYLNAPNPGTRAANLNTATAPSVNGRSISPSRWNKALLIARSDTNSATDAKPISDFTPPDWILVDRRGSNPVSWNSNLIWSASNPTTVVGRYAYVIYNEGGLLDANVAGHPTSLTIDKFPPLGQKSTIAFADLSSIGLNPTQIDTLVGWRNAASARSSGKFPSYNISTDGATNYGWLMMNVTNAFLGIYTNSLSGGEGPRSDRRFSGRRELIDFLKGADPSGTAGALNALRYLGTFSRDLNQPSYVPEPGRPKVLPVNQGGNDATGGDDLINPSYLTIRVDAPFARNDGTQAVVGEPLVKKRFPLSYLSWLTYQGPSANASQATKQAMLAQGIPQSIIDKGTPENILAWFGLTWDPTGFWIYRKGTASPIKTLARVRDAGRDPDFFELLKSAVTVGALGKAYTLGNLPSTPDGWNQEKDNSVDAQIMQIAANIIDQSDFDGYPTRIQFNDGMLFGGRLLEYRGVEDLPYIYRVREGKVMTQDSIPSVGTLPAIGAVTFPGTGVVLQEPEIWNPHAMTTNSTTAPRPTQFRLVASTMDPLSGSPSSFRISMQWRLSSGGWVTSSVSTTMVNNQAISFAIPSGRPDLFREPTLLIKPGVPSDSGLAGPGPYTLPASFPGAVQLVSNNVPDSRIYTGIPMWVNAPMTIAVQSSQAAIGWIRTPSNPTTAGITGYVPVTAVNYPTGNPPITYRLQCRDSLGNWVTYDERYDIVAAAQEYNSANGSAAGSAANATFWRQSGTGGAMNAIGSEISDLAFDPRCSRFGLQWAGSYGRGAMIQAIPLGAPVGYLADSRISMISLGGWAAPMTGTWSAGNSMIMNAARQMAIMTTRPDEYGGLIFSTYNASITYYGKNSGPTAPGWMPLGVSVVMRPGMIVQNNPNINNSSTLMYTGDVQTLNPAYAYPNQCFADADGVVRRAMAGWVPSTPVLPVKLSTSPNPSGLPLKTAYGFDGSGRATPITAGSGANEYLSRPIVLNRPFGSVAELGYVSSGTPWRNLDFCTPESMASALLDVFCISDSSGLEGLTAGRVSLNTRQTPVIQAILAGAYRDEFSNGTSLVSGPISTNLASAMGTALTTRTATNPLVNVSDLVGRWKGAVNVGGPYINGSKSYAGFSADDGSSSVDNIASVLSNSVIAVDPELRIMRFRESTVRALAATGQTRLWNLMIDVIAQTGRYPTSAKSLGGFLVEGERRYWVHLAIDRLTGRVVDKEIEMINE